MGTMIQRARLAEEDYRGARFRDWPRELRGNNDLLSLTQPRLVRDIHAQYLQAGADVIETNTFNSTSIALADYGMESLAREFNRAAATLARDAVREWISKTPNHPRFVAGVLGPTNKTASISPDVNDPGFRAVSFEELVTAYSEAIAGLLEGGVDLLMVETIFDTLNAKAALFAIEQTFASQAQRLPVIISGTITDASGRTLSGQTAEAFYNSVRHARPLAVGLNCALGAKELRPYVEELAGIAETLRLLPSERGPAQRVRRVRRHPGVDGRARRRVGARGLAQHRRRLLRHDARAHSRDWRGSALDPTQKDS